MTAEALLENPVRVSGRNHFRLILVAPVLALITLTCWALASPMGASPDDDFHLASIWCGGGDKANACQSVADPGEREVPEAVHQAARCYMGQPTVSASCQSSSFSLDPTHTVVTDRGSFESNYPPLYYATMSLFVSSDILSSVLVMRMVNAVLFVGITTLLYALLPGNRRPTLVWAWVVTLVPLGLFLLSSNNPSAWAIIGIGSAWLALLGYFESRGARKIGLGVVFAATALMAAGARGDAAMYVVLSSAVVMALTATSNRQYWVNALLPLGAALGAVGFYLSSRQSTVALTGLSELGPNASQDTGWFSALGSLVNVQSIWAGAFGSWPLGWFDTVMPAIVSFGGVACFAAVAFSGLRMRSRRKSAVLLFVAAILWLLPAYVLIQSRDVEGTPVQPRYILPLIVLLAGLTTLQVTRRRLSFSGLQLSFIVPTLAIAQAVALQYNMRRYITGTGHKGINLNSDIQWWWNIPVSPMVVWVCGCVAFAALLVVVVREVSKRHVLV